MWHFLLDLREQRKYLTWLKIGNTTNYVIQFQAWIFGANFSPTNIIFISPSGSSVVTWTLDTLPPTLTPVPSSNKAVLNQSPYNERPPIIPLLVLHPGPGELLLLLLGVCCESVAMQPRLGVSHGATHHPGIFHSGIPHLVRFWQKHYYSNVDVEIDSNLYSSSLE